MVLITRDESKISIFQDLPSNKLKNVVHPDLFLTVSDYKDKNALKRYGRGLYKSAMYSLGLLK